jgi:hypothetical protein
VNDTSDPKEILEAFFEAILQGTDKAINGAKEKGQLDDIARKGVSINLSGFKYGNEEYKATAKVVVNMGRTKMGRVFPRVSLSLHPKFKRSFNKRLMESLEVVLQTPTAKRRFGHDNRVLGAENVRQESNRQSEPDTEIF